MRPAELAYLDVAKARAQRYRLAWTSARQRAVSHLLALVESDEERDALRAALREANDNRLAIAKQHMELIEECRRRGAERDEARAELSKAGEEIRQLRADRAWEVKRANEAARLSADARDDAEARDQVIAEQREHIEIVEGDRLATLAWAMNVLAEHDVEHELGEEFAAIARYIRELKDVVATYRRVADSSIAAREEYAQEAERLGAQCQHLVNRANEFRGARDHLLKAGRDWLDAGYPTVGAPAGDAMASAIEDVIANVPEGQSMWALTTDQADALRALLGLVHYDDLARSWLALLPDEVHPQGASDVS